MKVYYINFQFFDYILILSRIDILLVYIKRFFRFVIVILDDYNFRKEVEEVWKEFIEGFYMFNVWEKFKILRGGIKDMNKECYGFDFKVQNM